MIDFDSPWKEALDRWFPAFLAFFFPHIYDDIDWSRGYEMLDKELQQVVREAELGRRHVDKLVKVWRKDGAETWVLIHVEVQGQPEEEFVRRMYVYNYRLFDRYNRVVVSLAVLTDEQASWRPSRYQSSLWGCTASLDFPVAKLLDYAKSAAELETNPNPFATVVLAHLQAQATRHDPKGRQTWKLRLVRGLYERGLSREDVQELFRFIDWVLELPAGLDRQFWVELEQYEKEKAMPYVTSVERLALQRGHQEGLRDGLQKGLRDGLLRGLELGLELRFGAPGKRLMGQIRQLEDVAKLETLHEALRTVASLDELQQLLP